MHHQRMMQLTMENQQLKIQLAAMQEKLKMIQEMAELRAKVAILESQIATMTRMNARTASRFQPPQLNPPNVAPYQPLPQLQPSQPHRPYQPKHPHRQLQPNQPLPTYSQPRKNPPVLPSHGSLSVPSQVPTVSPNPVAPISRSAVPLPRHIPVGTLPNRKKPSSNKKIVHVPDGGTVLIGGRIFRPKSGSPAAQLPISASVSNPIQPTITKRNLSDAEIKKIETQVRKLQTELKQIKSLRPVKELKIIPNSKSKSGKPPKASKKFPTEEMTRLAEWDAFRFYLGTLR